jgi:hypothetical protein
LYTDDGDKNELNFDQVNKMSEMLKDKLNFNDQSNPNAEKKSDISISNKVVDMSIDNLHEESKQMSTESKDLQDYE